MRVDRGVRDVGTDLRLQLVGEQGLSGIHPGGVNMRVSNEQCADRVAGGR